MVREFQKENSIINTYLNEIRDNTIQKDRMRFRANLKRIGSLMAYEISKKLDFSEREVITPLGKASGFDLKSQPILGTVLRAGLPLHEGFLSVFDKADNAFISAYRKHHSGDEFEVEVEYVSCPDIENRTLILVDPMLATGRSMYLSYQSLVKQFGKPAKTYIVSVIASNEGVEYIKEKIGKNAELYMGAIDEELTAQAYIVPGLGDAGDLAYGEKE
ncbi:uracil phosphoribosyltransferase [Salibacter halophilus]|uniref:Uracil phosphoribosyltransferase n=1 Tax=Salibacter halophilus TaxID=1803916 RepID=A0A6N6MCA3_9FLAO|nr:uracil phosphoribosyltransferase [Salibacter halophilus]KAB1066187.1 uracil phosphoribosyltransferase [Salibacter halophilus]